MINRFILLCVVLVLTTSDATHFGKYKNRLTENGWVAGERRSNYYAFEGMRFAAPPLGEGRFQPPQPYTKCWKGVRNATAFGSACMQWNPMIPGPDKVMGNEDCLFVNVYTPAKNPYRGYRFPVIVHLHNGAFQFGDGSAYGHEYIMRRGNFVFVSFNFRLGIFGFLSTKSSIVPGNMGFKDQVMALKWIQQNIDAFDGDVDSITLTGFGSGAASVHLHFMSPLSVGLFHRGISHSGTALAPWVLARNPLEKVIDVAERIQCPTTDQQGMIDCLRSKPAVELVRTVASMAETIGPRFGHPFMPYAAVVEDEHDEAFITDTPREYLQQRRIQKLPWLTSIVQNEGVYLATDLYSDETICKVNSNQDRYLALLADFSFPDPKTRTKVMSSLKSRFFGCKPLSHTNFNQLIGVVTQRYFHCATEESVRMQGKIAPVYTYLYKYKLQFGLGEYLTQSSVNLGVALGEDVLLIYNTSIHAPPFQFTDGEKTMSKRLLNMYATFAKHGVPKFNKQCLTRSKNIVQFTVIEDPDTVKQRVAEPICDKFWTEVANDLGDVF